MSKWIKTMLLVAGLIEIAVGLAHFAIPSFAYQAKGFSLLHQHELNFVTLCVSSIGILLMGFGGFTILLSLKSDANSFILFNFTFIQSLLWLARIVLQILFPVKVPLFHIPQPTTVVMPLLIFECLLFLFSVVLISKDRKGCLRYV